MKKILVVDDEKEIRDLLKTGLEKGGYAAMAVSSGEEALSICRKSLPDLMLLDIAMPGMDGYAVATEIKKEKNSRDIPIIFLTAKELTFESIEKRVGEVGAYDFVIKPCSFKELTEKIKSAIG